jgi:hypothetical protein
LDWGLCTPKQKKKRKEKEKEKKNYLTSCHALCFPYQRQFPMQNGPQLTDYKFFNRLHLGFFIIWHTNLNVSVQTRCSRIIHASCWVYVSGMGSAGTVPECGNSHQNGLLLDYRMFFPLNRKDGIRPSDAHHKRFWNSGIHVEWWASCRARFRVITSCT